MKSFRNLIVGFLILMIPLISCEYRRSNKNVIAAKQSILDTSKVQYLEIKEVSEKVDIALITPKDAALKDSILSPQPIINQTSIAIPKALPLVNFAKSLLKTPYVYGGKDPKTGFDSAGFISFVFNHFGISVPTLAAEFSNMGKTVSISEAAEGDLILISRSDLDKKIVAYVGIVVSKKGEPIEFIYVNYGKVRAVTISSFNNYYQKRLVKVVRIIP